jgi:catechol 2,3-dioxygenase-like lactoylglutathione lyase family enzyme
MSQHLGAVALVIRDYDEAKAYYCDTLGFTIMNDVDMGAGKRWVTLMPPGSGPTRLLLAKAATPMQSAAIGNQAGGRVFVFLHTDDFWRDYNTYNSRGVLFREEPRHEPYGIVAVFEDLYGNLWDLLQPAG